MQHWESMMHYRIRMPFLISFARWHHTLLLLSCSSPYKLREIASHLDAVIVLKASSVWIADADAVYIYHGANPSLGVAGSGDVLSGIIGAFLAAGEKPLNAAIDGVILHQRAGRNAHNTYHMDSIQRRSLYWRSEKQDEFPVLYSLHYVSYLLIAPSSC